MASLRTLSISACLALAPAAVSAQKQPAQQPPAPPSQKQVDTAIERGAQFLLASYAERLAPERGAFQERLGQTALSLYTVLKAGISKDDETVRRMVAQLASQPISGTYDLGCALLAVYAHDEIANRRWIEDLAHKLIDSQMVEGDWSYPAGTPDLSNTQYAALGLWTAEKAGVHIEKSVWSRLAEVVLDYQEKDGGFGYQALNMPGRGATGSMTAAGVGTLAICEIELRVAGACSPALADRLARARTRGLAWLTQRFAISPNPMLGGWSYYYLYGLERLGAFTGVARIGDHDWYGEGAAFLVEQQTAKGCWLNGSDLSDTCFAILFLRRATALRGPATGEDQAASTSDALVHIAASGDGAVRMWIERWNAKLARTLEWPGERGRGPRVTRVEFLGDDKLIAVRLGDPARACAGERFDATHIFDSAGKHRLKARVFVALPNTKPGEEQALESQELEVEVKRAMPAWTAELAVDLGRNLAVDAKGKAKATSVVQPKNAPLGLDYAAERALDDCAQSPWLADPKDTERTLTLTFVRGPECNVIRISPAVLPGFGPEYLSRPIELQVEVNGGDKHRLALDPDPQHGIALELEHRTAIRRLDIKVLSVATSSASPCFGIGEVELFATKK